MRIQAKGESLDIWIYEDIGKDIWTGGGITGKMVADALTQNRGLTNINVRINSMGGDVFEGVAIYNLLHQNPARVEIDVDGYALSAASVIAMAGDEIRMAENAMMMIHEPMNCLCGNAGAFREMADVLDKHAEAIASTYVARTGKTKKQVLDMMNAETWMSAKDAKDLGFCDKVTAAQKVAASFDLSRFKNVPKALLLMQPPPTARPRGEPDQVQRPPSPMARLTVEKPWNRPSS